MSHTIREKAKLLARIRRIRGQVEGLERALDAEKECAEILHQIAATRGAINGLMAEVLEEHIRTHVADPSIIGVSVHHDHAHLFATAKAGSPKAKSD